MTEQMSFEDALAKLEETVHRLEAGNLPLDEAVSLFEQGTLMAQLCNQRLDAAELKVSQLVQTSGGQIVEEDMPPEAELGGDESGA